MAEGTIAILRDDGYGCYGYEVGDLIVLSTGRRQSVLRIVSEVGPGRMAYRRLRMLEWTNFYWGVLRDTVTGLVNRPQKGDR